MRQLATQLIIGVVSMLSAASASAQNPFPYANPPTASYPYQGQAGQFQRPPILSPYLNLNRNLPAVNYFNFVQPQLQMNQQSGQFLGPPVPAYQPGNDVLIDQQDPTSVMPRPSGHASTFNNTGGYFNSLGTIGSGGGRPGGQQPAPGRRR